MRIQPRKGNGRYKHSSWYNFRKKKRGWREYAISPITVSVFGCLVWLGANTAWAMNELEKLDGRIDIYNFSADFTKFESESIREDSKGDGLSPSTTPEESTGETVKAVSDNPKSEEGQTPSQVQSPSSIEEKILKAWEGTNDGHIALKVFGCESGYNPETIGDKALAFEHNGQMYGRSIGIAQIRTGGIERNGKIWVASDNVAEFEEKMKNVDENLKAARAKYDARGWMPWYNCARKVGAL